MFTPNSNQEDFLNAFRKKKAEARKAQAKAAFHEFYKNLEDQYSTFNDWNGDNLSAEQIRQQVYGFESRTGFRVKTDARPDQQSVDSFFDTFRTVAAAAPIKKTPVTKETRIKQINEELDIIRGRVPTPKNYTVNPLRAKALMAELKQLS
jgi:hypothetical protein